MAKKPRTEKQKIAFAKAQYALARKRYEKRILYEQTLSLAPGTTISGDMGFQLAPRSADDILTQGIKRKVNGRFQTIKGLEALQIQTKSFANRASLKYLNQRYKDNYILAMERSQSFNFTDEDIARVRELLNSISDQHFELLVQKNSLPQIFELYATTEDFPMEQDIINQIEYSTQFGSPNDPATKRKRVTRGEIKQTREFQKTISENVKHILKIQTKL